MSKTLLSILVLAVGWTLAGPAAPADPAGTTPDAEAAGSANAATVEKAEKARLKGRIDHLQAGLRNILRKLGPAATPSAPETDTAEAPEAPEAEAAPAPSDAGAAPEAETPEAETPPAPAPVDRSQLQGQIEQFQAVIENALRRDVRSTVLSAPRGAYLEGYGAVFSTEASLYRIRPLTPFSSSPYSPQELDQAYQAALERVERLKQDLRQAVAEHGSLLGQLKPSHTLAVIVHLYNGVADPGRPYPSQLIVKAGAGSVTDYREGRITMEELAGRVRISQF